MDVVAWRCDSLHICHSLRKLSSRTCLNILYSFDLLSFNKIRIRIWIWRARPKTAILVETCWWDFQAIATRTHTLQLWDQQSGEHQSNPEALLDLCLQSMLSSANLRWVLMDRMFVSPFVWIFIRLTLRSHPY